MLVRLKTKQVKNFIFSIAGALAFVTVYMGYDPIHQFRSNSRKFLKPTNHVPILQQYSNICLGIYATVTVVLCLLCLQAVSAVYRAVLLHLCCL